ncbi:DNA-directed DNA polymerase gamma mip1 [Lunasporangiospora selenospora]|uniref:DNA polymerase subunit gamma-1 n=1 Tax=Lunasporangiospora selenospora TaxID=979761 RepID=A0A9P6KIT5_9FUNG|nr:DNA-directed DNA polymerase gamma mip1 [Lunasporangiospora selenospora]
MSAQVEAPRTSMRKNEVDVQMLHPGLHSKVFPSSTGTGVAAESRPTPEMIKCAISHLEKSNLWGKDPILVPDTTFPVPHLRGNTIEDHFYNIGVRDSATYKKLAVDFSQLPSHPLPDTWLMQEGWTRYGKDGTISRVEYPLEKTFTFDVETVPALSKFPVMACALSSEAWYGWVSPWLINPQTVDGHQNDQHLMSFGPSPNKAGHEKILIGHNVGYDRARVLEEYSIEQNGIRYLDTMSLHVAVSGLCSQQRPGWIKYSKATENEDTAYLDAFKDTTGKYFDVSAVNSLLQVSKFHCSIHMDKAPRNILMEAKDIKLIQDNFQDLMQYCGKDVTATHAVFQQTFPKYLEKCPHPVSFAGVLQMGSSFLTVNEGWTDYITRCNRLYNEISENVESKLSLLAHQALENYEKDNAFYKDDPWLSQLNWEFPKREWKEGIPLKSGNGYRKGCEPRWVCRAKLLPDKPEWYRDLWDSSEKRIRLSTRQRVAPILLKLQWHGYPLVHSGLYGWTFQVPMDDKEYVTRLDPLTFPLENEEGYQKAFDLQNYRYYRLPHKSGEGMNVGNPLSKGYVSHFDDHILSSYSPPGDSDDSSTKLAKQALDMNAQCAYWVSAKERIEDQFVVWEKDVNGLGKRMGLPSRGETRNSGIILPQIVTMGTVTRRAVEKTWMTASNAKKNRIGSELKSNVEAPAGYKIVGADVDSEELWISSLMGDAQFRMHGATALGWMTLQGTKSAGTDLHSKTAQIMGISRDQAKIFNYGRIYGAGVNFATRLLQQFNSSIDTVEAKQKAQDLYTATKGVKISRPQEYEVVHDRPFWHGGTESYMFNSLERTATAEDPRTPTLGCGITDALRPKYTENQFMTSRVNWVVQSSGVDYLHMLLVSMNYLIHKYDIKARFMLCVHDEVRYMVKEEDSARAALAMQVSNLWTRAMFSYKLGIYDLPQSVAFFSAVDIDHVFRKEVNMDCITPTQKTPIPHGTSLDIEQTLELTEGGQLGEIATDFVEAEDGPAPLELRSVHERQRVMITSEQTSNTSPDMDTESGVILHKPMEAPQEDCLFLEAQTMSSISEIKKAVARKKAEALALWKAKVEAEKQAAAKMIKSGSGDDNDDNSPSDSQKGLVKSASAPKQASLRHVRDASPLFKYGKKVQKPGGFWGRRAEGVDPANHGSDQGKEPVTEVKTGSLEEDVESYELSDMALTEVVEIPVAKAKSTKPKKSSGLRDYEKELLPDFVEKPATASKRKSRLTNEVLAPSMAIWLAQHDDGFHNRSTVDTITTPNKQPPSPPKMHSFVPVDKYYPNSTSSASASSRFMSSSRRYVPPLKQKQARVKSQMQRRNSVVSEKGGMSTTELVSDRNDLDQLAKVTSE